MTSDTLTRVMSADVFLVVVGMIEHSIAVSMIILPCHMYIMYTPFAVTTNRLMLEKALTLHIFAIFDVHS